MRIVEFARSNRLPFTWRDTGSDDEAGAALVAGLDADELPLVRLPGGVELRGPSSGQVSRALGIGRELAPREEVDLVIVGGGPAGLGAAVYGASEGLETLVVEGTALGGQAGTSRRIENYLGFPAGISGSELTSRAVSQARKFEARTATPYRAAVARAVRRRTLLVRLEEGHEIVAPHGAARDRRAVPAPARRGTLATTRASASSTRPGRPEARLCGASRVGVVGGGNSAGQAAVWLARGGALVTLLHRRADLRETMSDYLVRELERYGVAVRDRSEIAELHGDDGQLEEVTLKSGERLPFSFLFLFLGALPCTEWLGDVVARDDKGFILTGDSRRRRQPARDERARASSPPATCARARPSAARPPSARERWPCSSCTPGLPSADERPGFVNRGRPLFVEALVLSQEAAGGSMARRSASGLWRAGAAPPAAVRFSRDGPARATTEHHQDSSAPQLGVASALRVASSAGTNWARRRSGWLVGIDCRWCRVRRPSRGCSSDLRARLRVEHLVPRPQLAECRTRFQQRVDQARKAGSS